MISHQPIAGLRIVWITETFYPPIVGGQERLAHFLTAGMAAAGASVAVITRQTIPPSPGHERIGDVEVQRIFPAGFLKGKGWKAALPLVQFLARLALLLYRKRKSYDVVIVSSVKLMPLVVVPMTLLLGKKSLLRAESIFELKEPISAESLGSMGKPGGRFLLNLLRHLRTAALRRASAVVAISGEIERQLRSTGIDPSRIVRIANAVDLRRFHPVTTDRKIALKRQLRFPASRQHVIYVGRLSRAKGLPLLLECWPAVLKSHPGACLLLVGSGNASFDDCEAQLQDFVRMSGLGNDVFFLGEHENVNEYLQAADVFVFPSEYEGFSLVLVEAMACGLPVVVSTVGGAPDIIQNGTNGFLFPPKEGASLIATLCLALESQDRWTEIGTRAHRTAKDFDFEVIVSRYMEQCRTLAYGAAEAPIDRRVGQ